MAFCTRWLRQERATYRLPEKPTPVLFNHKVGGTAISCLLIIAISHLFFVLFHFNNASLVGYAKLVFSPNKHVSFSIPSFSFSQKPPWARQSIKVKAGRLSLPHTLSLDTLPKNTKLPAQSHPSKWPETTYMMNIYRDISETVGPSLCSPSVQAD